MIYKKLKKRTDESKYPLNGALHRRVKNLIKDGKCCNYRDGECLLLDDGNPVYCPQERANELCCTYFQEAVLPMDESLEAEILRDNTIKVCEICGTLFVLKSNRGKYCPECAAEVRRKQKAEHERKRRKNMDI